MYNFLLALTNGTSVDLFAFIAKIVEALAWPVAAVVLVLLLRREIIGLAPYIRKLKAGPLEAEFEREVRELRTAMDRTASGGVSLAQPDWQVASEQLAQVNPRAAIFEAWRQTEIAAIRELQARQPNLSNEQVRSTREVLRLLGESGLATPEDVALLNQMRFLRNQAAHVESFQPTYEAAMNFVQLGAHLMGRIASRRSEG
jgi:hypothetical protein